MSFYPLFHNPPTAYRLVPFWFWNSDMDAEEITYQIKEMAEKGIGGFFICARQGLKTPYLSDEWFQYVAVAVKAAQESGLEVWLYDEYPYPSGMSGGEVTLERPDARHRQLLHRSITVTGPQVLSYDLPWARVLCAQAIPLEEERGEQQWSEAIDLVQFVGSVPAEEVFQSTGLTTYTNKRFFTAQLQKRLSWNVPSGRWMISIFLEKEVEDFKYFGHYVDPCHKEAIQTFIQTTHERYAHHFEQDFGETIKGLFTDEVGLLSHIPWSARLPDFFRDRSGYDLIGNLPTLLYGRGERAAQVRYDFFQGIHQLLSAAYYEPVSDWCDRHRLQFVTEVTSIRMTTQRYSHVPGGDSAHEKVGRSLEWILDCNAYSLRADPKIASSIARQLGCERSMIECFHSVGWSMTLQDAKWMLDRLAAFGINLFIFHAFFYSISGLRKHDAPPSQFLQNPYWEHFRALADYAGRLGYSMSQGKADVPIAVLHPVTTFWTHMGNAFHGFKYCGNDAAEERELERLKQDWAYLRNQLLLHQVDYDHLDPELLAEATIEDGQLMIGQACYRVLILPPMTNLEAAAWSQVKAFLHAGGIVIGVGLLPYERIDHGLNIEAEFLEEFALTESPSQSYWQDLDGEETSDIEVVPAQELPWIKGAHGAYFIPCVGGAQRAQASERLLALLQQCVLPVVTLEAVMGDRTSLLMQQRVLPDESRLIFIAHQEGMEKTLRLHLAKCPVGQRVERLDLATGEATFISVEESGDGWSMPLYFAPYESHLLRFSSHEEVQAGEEACVEVQAQQPWKFAIDVQDSWKLTARQDNIVRFGSFHFTPDLDNAGLLLGWHAGNSAQEWPLVEAKPFINQCADIADRQAFPLRLKQTFGTPVDSALAYPMHCWYQSTFFVEAHPSTCQLMMDEDAIGGIYTIYLNGKQVPVKDFVSDGRYGYQRLACEVQQLLKAGINHLVVRVEVQRDEDGLRDPLYLSGPFGVFLDATGKPTIGQAPETGVPQRGVLQGYPYYAGTLCFTKEFSIGTLPGGKTFVLALQGWNQQIHDCVEVVVNGNSLGVCCWSPYRWEGDSNILRGGINTAEMRVTNTLSAMLEGTYFDE
jgi:hypothetical protein